MGREVKEVTVKENALATFNSLLKENISLKIN